MKRMRKDCYQFQIWFRIIYLIPVLKQNVLYKFSCKKDVDPAVEVVVNVININYGHNEHLMQGCGLLSQYAQFVAVTREYANNYDNREEAMNAAIEYCIGHGILEDILRKHRSQVLGSLLEEFDEKKYARTLREEGYESGREEGYEVGRTEGGYEKEQELLQNLMNSMNITESEAMEKLGIKKK